MMISSWILWLSVTLPACWAASAFSSSSLSPNKLPITLLTGFLGSGKTCTLQHLLDNAENLKIGVIVNDVASVNIDSKLVSGKTESGVVELQNGCACCSLAEELLTSVDALLENDVRRELDALVVELSGVADPMAIQANWKTAASNGHPVTEKADLSQVVTLIDASTFGTDWMSYDMAVDRNWAEDGDCAGHREVPELLAEQVEAANVIVINKKDLAGPDQVQVASSLARTLNPDATMEEVEYGRVTPNTIVNKRSTEEGSAQDDIDNDAEGVDDIDNMSLAELEDLVLALHGDEGSIPKGFTLEDARDYAWNIVVNYASDHPHSHDHEHESTSTLPASSTHVDALGITSFVYKADRPFHTEKLLTLLSQWPVPIKNELDLSLLRKAQQDGEYQVDGKRPPQEASPFIGVLRSKGFCWFAPTKWHGIGEDPWRHNTAMYWSHAGRHFGITEAGKWWDTISKEDMKPRFFQNMDEYERILREDFVSEEFGDRRQEVVFIGVGMDEEKITEALNSCLISKGEEMETYRQESDEYRRESSIDD